MKAKTQSEERNDSTPEGEGLSRRKVLATGAALLIRTFMNLQAVDPGFAMHNVMSMSMSVSGERFQTTAPVAQVVQQGADRLRSVPGILDAGASKLSAEDFKQQIVGRTVAGATPSGYEIDVFYHDNGRLIGGGRSTPRGGALGGGASFSIEGSWTIDPSERICTRISVRLPAQCQFWFKRGNDYFLADSDWDRDVGVTRRTLTHK